MSPKIKKQSGKNPLASSGRKYGNGPGDCPHDYRVTIFDEDDGTYLVEFEKYFKSIFESLEESTKRQQEYIKSLGK